MHKEDNNMAIDYKNIAQTIREIIAQKLSIDSSRVTEQSTLQDLGADSLDMVEIIMKIEEEYTIEINDEEAEKLHNVGDVIAYVHKLTTRS